MTEHELMQRWACVTDMADALKAILTDHYDMIYYDEFKALTCYYDNLFKLMAYEGIVHKDEKPTLDQAIEKTKKELGL